MLYPMPCNHVALCLFFPCRFLIMNSCKVSDKQEREEGSFPDMLNKENGPQFIQQQSQVRLGATLVSTRKQEVCVCIQMWSHSNPGTRSCSRGLTLLVPCGRKDASRRRSHYRQKGEQPKTELKRAVALILTKGKQSFYHRPLSDDAMSGAMVQAQHRCDYVISFNRLTASP